MILLIAAVVGGEEEDAEAEVDGIGSEVSKRCLRNEF